MNLHDTIQAALQFNQSLDRRVPLFSPLVILLFVVGGYVFVQMLVATEKVKRGRPTHMTEGKASAWALVVLVIFLLILMGAK